MNTWTLEDSKRAPHFGWCLSFQRPHMVIISCDSRFKSDRDARNHVLDFAFGPSAPLPDGIREEVLLCRKAITYIIMGGAA